MTATAELVEKQRRKSNRDRLLDHLLEHGSATNVELSQVAGLRFGARLMELRGLGWQVETKDEGGGLVRYTMTRSTPLGDGQQTLFGGR